MNPLAGCFPMLVQMPIFSAYSTCYAPPPSFVMSLSSGFLIYLSLIQF